MPPNTNTADSSTIADALSEAPDNVKAASARAEQVLLTRMFGIDWGADQNASQLAVRVMTAVNGVRANLNGLEIQNVLEPNIDAALRAVTNAPVTHSFPADLRRVHAVAEAIWRSIPQDITPDVIAYSALNPNIAADNEHRYEYALPHRVPIAGQMCNVFVNTRHAFWIESGPFDDIVALITELEGKELEYAGIRAVPPAGAVIPVSHTLTNGEARVIARQRVNAIAGRGVVNLHELQTELRARYSQFRRLQEGTDNVHGAALAAAILVQHRDAAIQNALGGGRSEQQINNEIATSQNRQSLTRSIEQLEQHPLRNVTRSWADNRDALGPQSAVATAAIQLGTAGVTITVAGENYTVTGNTNRDVSQALAWLTAVQGRVRAEIAEFDRCYRQLAEIARVVTALGGNIAPLTRYLGAAPGFAPNYAHFTETENFNTALALLKADAQMRLSEDHQGQLTKLATELKDTRDGKMTGLTGAAGQHAVISKYFEQVHRLPPTDAATASQYVRGRSKLDSELVSISNEISDGLFGDDRSFGERVIDSTKNVLTNFTWGTDGHAANIVRDVARGAGINAPLALGNPRWRSADYRQLITAYFSLKKLYNGEAPKGLALPKSQYVQQQMREISVLLTQKHAIRMLQEFGPVHNISDERMQELLKEPSKAELARVVEDFLTGELPANYKGRLDDAVNYADRHVEWKRRTLKWAAGGTLGAGKSVVVGGARKGFAAGKWGVVKTVGVTKKVAYDAPVAIGKGVWKNKGKIALIGAASILGGPVLGGFAWYASKQFSGSNAA